MAVQNGRRSHIENQKYGISWYRWVKKSNKVSFTVISGIKKVKEWFLIFSETILTFKSNMAAQKWPLMTYWKTWKVENLVSEES